MLAGYLAALAGSWTPAVRDSLAVFLLGAGVVTAVGIWFSLNELTGAAACPTFEGLPMCYVSLLAGASMLAVDALRIRTAAAGQW